MLVARILILSIVFSFGCKQLSSLSSAENNGERALPSLYAKDYGTIVFKDTYTQQASKLGIIEHQSIINTLWAQEAVGTPEARAFLEEMRKEGFTFSSPKLAITDNGFDLREGGHPRLSYRWNETIRDHFDSKIIPFKQRSQERADASHKYLTELEDEGKILSAASRQGRGDGIAHGTNTLGIIAGEHPVGISTHGVVHQLSTDTKQLASSLAEGKISADVVNSSQGYNSILEWKGVAEDTEEVKRWSTFKVDEPNIEQSRLEGYKKLVDDIKKLPETTLWVNSAGNSFPHPIDDIKRQIKDKAILVGSADPSGFPSYFSQADESIVVLAPSDYSLQSIDADGKLAKYGGTSGAAPMVSGVLADVKAILPGLTRREATAMLRITATRTSINSVSKVNGPGMLNHYKMLRVAQRIAERLQQDSSATIFSLLQDPKITRFHDETAKLYLEAKQAFHLQNHDEMFKKLRQAFFLTDRKDELQQGIRTQLADFYEKAHQPASAEFYRMPMTAPEWRVNMAEYLKRIRNKGDNIKMSLTDREVMATKLYSRNFMTYSIYARQEISNLRTWIKKIKEMAS